MTVRVHELFRIAKKAVPPVPPAAPMMFFITQPTDTEEHELFEPPIRVGISDQGSDSLTIAAAAQTCSDIQPITVTATSEGATFFGLRAGDEARGCRLRVRNNTRPQISVIVSEPFDVTEEERRVWRVINTESAASQDLFTVSLTMDTRGANCIILSVSMLGTSAPSIVDSEGNTNYVTYAVEPSGGLSIRFLVVIDPDTAEDHNFYLYGVGTTYMALNALAVHAPEPRVQWTAVGRTVDTTEVETAPVTVLFSNALAVSGWSGNAFEQTPTGPINYEVYGREIGRPGLNFPMFSALKFFDGPRVEQPSWSLPTPNVQSTNLIVLSGTEQPRRPFRLISSEYVEATSNTSSSVSMTLDTVGASLIVIALGGYFSGASTSMVPSPNIPFASTPYQHPTDFTTRELGLRLFYFLNPNPAATSPNHLFTLTLTSVAGPSTPAMWGFAFAAERPVMFGSLSGNALLNVSSIQAVNALDINFNEAIVLSAAFTSVAGSPFIFPAGYQTFFEPPNRFPLAFGFRFPPNPTIENPVWSTIANGTLCTDLISFRAAP